MVDNVLDVAVMGGGVQYLTSCIKFHVYLVIRFDNRVAPNLTFSNSAKAEFAEFWNSNSAEAEAKAEFG